MQASGPEDSRSNARSRAEWFVVGGIVVIVLGLIGSGLLQFDRAPDVEPRTTKTAPPPPPSPPPASVKVVRPANLPAPRQTPPEPDLTGERLEVTSLKANDTGGASKKKNPRSFTPGGMKNILDPENEVKLYWDGVPDELRTNSVKAPDDYRNIRRADYSGPESCKECHKENYDAWRGHAHRLMNANATDETVRADFSAGLSLDYLGGVARFHMENGKRRMTLERDGVQRVYSITRTLGSRFFQYYIGLLVDGPEPPDEPARTIEELLPVGYWIDKQEIVPVVHVHGEPSEEHRHDPFSGPSGTPYNRRCATCHTTVPAGDWIMSAPGSARMQQFTPRNISFFASRYLAETYPDLVDPNRKFSEVSLPEITEILRDKINEKINPHNAVSLGISCEACHLGCAQHAKNEKLKPRFFPSDPLIMIKDGTPKEIWDRTAENKNWSCSRCHSGERPKLAGGMDTWNSTEYSDAVKGFCYDSKKAAAHGMKQLTCVHCHDPHKGIGKKWPLTPQQDDAKCLDCHAEFKKPEELKTHTHHSSESAGSRCMNCHMPKINEGLQDMVRTHVIFNPTNRKMIEANEPNACNLCHLDKPIDWTIDNLRKWYGEEHVYNEWELAKNYPERNGPTGIGYLRSPREAVRLIASEAIFKSGDRSAIPNLINLLNDRFLLNRQFTEKNFQQEFGVDPRKFGYRFTMTLDERQKPIKRMRDAFLPPKVVQ
jgi:hypothetical protein